MLLLTDQRNERNIEGHLADALIGIYFPECEEWELPPFLDSLYIACGYFSSVWAIPGDPFKVIKVSHRSEDACRGYMEWACAHPHPNAPKIHSIVHIDHLMMVVMDRYYPLEDDINTPFEDSYCKRENVPGYAVLKGHRPPDHRLGHEQLCARIRREFIRTQFDLHKGNVMLDRHGNFIITDPVSYKVDRYGDIIYDS